MRAYLYDADGNDQECQLDAVDVDALGENQFLWVDVDGGDDEVRSAGRVLALDGETMAALLDGSRVPSLFVHEDYFQVSVTAVQGEADDYPDGVARLCGGAKLGAYEPPGTGRVPRGLRR